ncbi:MAG TPA: ankyrin repeat domain-containing protein [bacterium]|jgi:ankyrin repeat protein|nr:ankyrin repeat domain-containing protein [bacterium]MDX9804816.1 ankyrin repeat domain-containing protein [bacterium]HNZ53461.1 ankyrin repeat domain-containing protein [bacterium]HOB70629.1 ankyrin repeat domain-containing protein [bacterium]HOG44088.1 ankyrin repeat domain-containing protein [bacterium]
MAEMYYYSLLFRGSNPEEKGKEMELSGIIAISVIVIFVILVGWAIKKVLYLPPETIFGAVMEFRYDLIDEYLKKGGDINKTNSFGMTFLMIACDKGVKFGRHKYADWNDGPYESVLELIDYLIENGADVHRRDRDGNTALYFACGVEERMERILNAGADINYKNNKGETPLIEAARLNYPITTEQLLKLGADPRIKDSKDLDAFDHAIQNDHRYLAEIIRKYMEKTIHNS